MHFFRPLLLSYHVWNKNNAVYEATLNIANDINGRKILYDIDPIKKVAEGAVKSATTTVTVNSISNSAGNVNIQNSENFKGSSYEEMLAAQREKLQKNGAKTGVTMEVDDWVEMAKNMSEKLDIESLEWRDPARALDRIAGRNRKIRNELYELIEKPLHESQGKYAMNLKEKVGDMSQKFAELGIKAKSAESNAVQDWIRPYFGKFIQRRCSICHYYTTKYYWYQRNQKRVWERRH